MTAETPAMGNQGGALDSYALGPSDMNRRFTGNNDPYVIARNFYPFLALTHGFSATSTSYANTDVSSAIDTGAVATATLYSVTPFAQYMSQYVWPKYKSLIAMTFGTSTIVSEYEFIRYMAMSLRCYYLARSIVSLNQLRERYDWTKIFPYTSTIPACVVSEADVKYCTDWGLQEYWFPILTRVESLVLPPNMVAEIKRTTSPFVLSAGGGRLAVPTYSTFFSATSSPSSMKTELDGFLDYIESNLATVHSVLMRVTPYLVKDQTPWDDVPIDYSVNRESGWINSTLGSYIGFGPGSGTPPTNKEALFQKSGENYTYYSAYQQAIWAEVSSGNIYHDNGSGHWAVITPHTYSAIRCMDDNGSTVNGAGGVGSTPFEILNSALLACRFWEPTYVQGYNPNNRVNAIVPVDGALNFLQFAVMHYFNLRDRKSVV